MGFLVSARQKSVLIFLPLCYGVLVFGLLQVVEGGLLFFRYAADHHPSALRRASTWVAGVNMADGLTAAYTAWRPSAFMALATAIGFLLDAILHCLMFVLRFETIVKDHGWLTRNFIVVAVLHFCGFALLVYMVRSCFTLHQVLKLGGTGYEFKSPTELAEDGGFPDYNEFYRGNTLEEENRMLMAKSSADDYRTDEPVYI